MQNDFENAPDYVFGWLQNKPYETLSPKEKEELHSFFSEEEYRDMHKAMLALSDDTATRIKYNVMGHFDKVHTQARIVGLPSRNNGWLKVAAILVPFMALAGFVLLREVSSDRLVSEVVLHDTVFVKGESTTDTIVQHDTVYLKSSLAVRQEARARAASPQTFAGSEDLGSMGILSIGQIDATPNAVKGNSLKEDTLWLQFEAASL